MALAQSNTRLDWEKRNGVAIDSFKYGDIEKEPRPMDVLLLL
jgi:hypothetical protein